MGEDCRDWVRDDEHIVLAEKTDAEVATEAVLAEPRESAAPQSPPDASRVYG
jgi:hypothetical protein